MKILLEIAYDGRNFCGFQVQNNGRTVQKTLQEALEALFGEKLSVSGCSRTDSGVHARQFFCTAEGNIPSNFPWDKLPVAALRFLPGDLSVRCARPVADSFHVRYGVRRKTYAYVILNRAVGDPFLAGLVTRYPRPLDEKAMDRAAALLVGRHDFSSFMAAGSKILDPVREIFDFHVRRRGDFVIFTVTADGFLYNMVRILCGTLVGVSEGKIAPEALPGIIEAKNRGLAGATLPPDGLYLVHVDYGDALGEENPRNTGMNAPVPGADLFY